MRGMKLFPIGFALAGFLSFFAAGCAGWQRDTGPILEREAFTALEEMVNAYESRNISAFREKVSGGYAGDPAILESSVTRAFSRYARIFLRVSPAGAALSSDRRRVALTVQFNRQLTPVATGEPESDEGMTTVTMVRSREGWKLERQGTPRLFGI